MIPVLLSLMILLTPSFIRADGGFETPKFYFTPFVMKEEGKYKVLLEWGVIGGSLPSDMVSFKIYRGSGGGFNLNLIGEVPRKIPSENGIKSIVEKYNRVDEVVELLNNFLNGTSVDSSNFASYLRSLMTNSSMAMFSSLAARYSYPLAIIQGLAYVDEHVSYGGNYTYAIKAVMKDGSESTFIGITNVSIDSPYILPAPENFRQVVVGGCSDIKKMLNNGKIYLKWDPPKGIEGLSLSLMIYGYDIYRSESNVTGVDLRTAIPSGFVKVNRLPVVVSATSEDADYFLVDPPGSDTFDPGKKYYYYIVARDISGGYSETAGPLEVEVPYVIPPPTPWRVHAVEIRDESGTPRLKLVWDRINYENYVEEFLFDKGLLGRSIAPKSPPIYTVSFGNASIDRYIGARYYLVLRFDSRDEARMWSYDSDYDLWPDAIEMKNGTDPCDPASHPSSSNVKVIDGISYELPKYVVDVIEDGDPSHTAKVGDKEIVFFVDNSVKPDNKVHWYRVVAIGEIYQIGSERLMAISPPSPPVRGVLYNRSLPIAGGVIKELKCSFSTKVVKKCETSGVKNGSDRVLDYVIYSSCDGVIQKGTIAPGDFLNLKDLGCKAQCSYNLQVYYKGSLVLNKDITDLCEIRRCYYIDANCFWDTVDTPDVVTGPIKICPEFGADGVVARIYQSDASGRYHPITKVYSNSSDGCSDPIDFSGISSDTVCLAIRVFSKNFVGSSMYYLPCVQVKSNKTSLSPPSLDPVEVEGSEGAPSFKLSWSTPDAGIMAFIIRAMKEGGNTTYKTYWVSDGSKGYYEYSFPIDSSSSQSNWCFQVKAVDRALIQSPWSNEECGVWTMMEEEKEHLGWPYVSIPSVAGSVDALYLKMGQVGLPVVILSDEISLKERECDIPYNYPPICGGSSVCIDLLGGSVDIPSCDLCSYLKGKMKHRNFMVFRQEEGKDFVEVSPLIEEVNCAKSGVGSTIDDPFIHFVNISYGSLGKRLVFVDRYPLSSGSKVRYQLLEFDGETKALKAIYMSNWVNIP